MGARFRAQLALDTLQKPRDTPQAPMLPQSRTSTDTHHAPSMAHEPLQSSVDRSSGTFLELTDVAKVYSTESVETLALREVHLEVKRGEWVAIVGPSGSG